MAKFTFKRHKLEAGLASVGRPYPYVDIKLSGKIVGGIQPPTRFGADTFRVMFMIVSEKEKCGWAWAILKAHFESEQEAREFVSTNSERIQARYRLRASEE